MKMGCFPLFMEDLKAPESLMIKWEKTGSLTQFLFLLLKRFKPATKLNWA